MDDGLKQVGPLERVNSPVLRIVHMHVAAVLGEVGVGERAAGPVERVAIAVLVALEADVDVDGGCGAGLGEGERGHRLPHLEGLSDSTVPMMFLKRTKSRANYGLLCIRQYTITEKSGRDRTK